MEPTARSETRAERLDRNLSELLQELRVAQTGVQVLFAFLLTVPFSSRFDELTDFQRGAYFAALMGAALASVFLIAPTSVHRLLFRLGQKRYTVELSNRLTIVGLVMVALSMTAVMLLVSDVMFGTGVAVAIAAFVGLAFAVLWFALPLERRWKATGRLAGDGELLDFAESDVGPPGSATGPTQDRLRTVLAPAKPLVDVDGATVVVTAVELWSRCVVVHLAALHTTTTPPGEPGERLARLEVTLADDAGTRYHPTGSSAAGGEAEWRAQWQFKPGLPPDAARLTITVCGADGDRHEQVLEVPAGR